VTLSLRATSKVWVCLLGEGGQRLIGGTVLSPEERATVFHARTFKLNLGNAHVELLIDGRLEPVRESSRAIGYSITSAGRTPLPPGHLPTCA
jgi:hypothetical protein